MLQKHLRNEWGDQTHNTPCFRRGCAQIRELMKHILAQNWHLLLLLKAYVFVTAVTVGCDCWCSVSSLSATAGVLHSYTCTYLYWRFLSCYDRHLVLDQTVRVAGSCFSMKNDLRTPARKRGPEPGTIFLHSIVYHVVFPVYLMNHGLSLDLWFLGIN